MEVNKWKEMEGNLWKDNINMEEVEIILNKAKELEIKEEIENFIIYIQNIIKELNNYYFPNKPNPAIYTILNNSLNILNMKIKNKSQSKFKFKSNSNTVSVTELGPTDTNSTQDSSAVKDTSIKDTNSTTTKDISTEDTNNEDITAVVPDTVTEEINEVKIFNENYIIKNIQNQK
uniref:Uncharacterized protein n=1 Tax=Theileria annulata TaxID=5874 RepID=A0A3B0MSH5_THEAN